MPPLRRHISTSRSRRRSTEAFLAAVYREAAWAYLFYNGSRPGYALERFALNLECNLVETYRSQHVEHANDVSVNRRRVTADEYLRFRILIVNSFQPLEQFIVIHLFFIEVRVPIGIHRDTDVIALGLRLARLAGRQGHLDTFHEYLTQTHHHEAGQKKEHDIEQRDDLDPRFLLRDGRGHI